MSHLGHYPETKHGGRYEGATAEFLLPSSGAGEELVSRRLVQRQAYGRLLWGVIVETGVFPGRPRLSWLSAPFTAKHNAVWRARAFLCVCELWHPPLRESGDGSLRNKVAFGVWLELLQD